MRLDQKRFAAEDYLSYFVPGPWGIIWLWDKVGKVVLQSLDKPWLCCIIYRYRLSQVKHMHMHIYICV